MQGLVECTLLRDLGKNKKRGDVVVYDKFKAEAWAKAGIVKLGKHDLKPAPEIHTAAAEEPEEKPRRRRKKKDEEEVVEEESE